MSVGTITLRDAGAFDARAVASSGARRRPARATAYPSSNSASATALPTPVPAPVTIATLVDREGILRTPDARPPLEHGATGGSYPALGIRTVISAVPNRGVPPCRL